MSHPLASRASFACRALCFAAAALVSGCDGAGGPIFGLGTRLDADVADADDGGSTDAGRDGGHDEEAPRVTSTSPRSGDVRVELDRVLEIRFSERVTAARGTVLAETEDGGEIALAPPTLDATADVVRVRPVTTWPTTSRAMITIDGFADLAGNAMTSPVVVAFTTADEGPPAVVEASPAEGATGVDVGLDLVSVRFSEAMSPHGVSATLSGGAGAIGIVRWTSDRDLQVEVIGLEPGTHYAVSLHGLEDVEGNALDLVSYLADGALDFTTARDEVPPTLVDSLPTNGQTDLHVLALPEIVLSFSETMDTSVRTAALDDGAGPTTLIGNWNDAGDELRFVVTSRLSLAAEHHLDLSGLRDRAGNALAPDVGLDAGVLVFTTTATDERLPIVVFSSPAEGSTDFRTRATTIDILFSEAMATTSSDVTLTSSALTRTLAGTWNTARTRLSLAVGAPLPARTAFSIDLRAFADASGNVLDAAHPYLADGALDFVTGGPSGESCADPLTLAESMLDGAAHVWDLSTAFVGSDAPPSCAGLGLSDGFVAYEKTTGRLGEIGGRALRITATMSRTSTFNLLSMEVSRGVCDPAAPGGGDAAREICVGPRRQWVQYLDVPAGMHFLSLAISSSAGTSTTWSGLELRIEEVDAIPEGESCGDPFDASSAIHASPSTDVDVWLLPHASGSSVEQSTSTDDRFACNPFDQGPDAVIELTKRRNGSILDVAVDPFPSGDWAGTHFEARATCERPVAPDLPLSCTRSVTSPRRFQIDADAGPLWLWIAAHDTESPLLQTEVRVREIDPGPGESCRSAIPVDVDATNAITPSATADYFHPSCLPAGAVTWYRLTTTREVTSVTTTGLAPIAVIDAATSTELGCALDATSASFGRRAPIGTELCIAVPTSMGPSALVIRQHDWRGIAGTATTLPITRPVDGAGAPLPWTGESWLAVTPESLLMGINVTSASNAALIVAPRTGGAASRVLTTSTAIGLGAATRGSALFSIDERASGAARLFRLVSPSGAIEMPPMGWDPGSIHPSLALRGLSSMGADGLAIAGASTSGAAFLTASSAVAGPVTVQGANADVTAVHAIAADATYLWFTGTVRNGTSSRTSVYRLAWASLGSRPLLLVPPELVSVSASNAGIVYDGGRDILYFRSARTGDVGVFAVLDASTATPTFAGRVVARGRAFDAGLALDPSIPALFLFETETDAAGVLVEVR